MKELVKELSEKFRKPLSHEPENLINLKIKVLLGNVIFTMYNRGKINASEWTEAMDIINNLNE